MAISQVRHQLCLVFGALARVASIMMGVNDIQNSKHICKYCDDRPLQRSCGSPVLCVTIVLCGTSEVFCSALLHGLPFLMRTNFWTLAGSSSLSHPRNFRRGCEHWCLFGFFHASDLEMCVIVEVLQHRNKTCHCEVRGQTRVGLILFSDFDGW